MRASAQRARVLGAIAGPAGWHTAFGASRHWPEARVPHSWARGRYARGSRRAPAWHEWAPDTRRAGRWG